MSEIKKLNAGCAVNKLLALGVLGQEKTSQGLETLEAKLQAKEMIQKIKEHALVAKVQEKLNGALVPNALWALLGFAMVLHGAQFKNLFLCIQLIKSFYYDRVTDSISKLKASVTTALDKMKADAPDAPEADAKAEPQPGNKHAAKRAGKKEAANSEKSTEESAAAAKKALKAMDSAQLSNTAFEVCSAAMAAHMVMHTRLGQAIVLAHHLVNVAMEKTDKLVDFAGLEDLSAWTHLFLRFVFYCKFIALAVIAAPLALALDVSVFGAQLVLQYGAQAAQAYGKLPDAEAFVASKNGLLAVAGITAFGTIWQFWSLMAASGMAWYFQLAYLPAVIAETVVGCF